MPSGPEGSPRIPNQQASEFRPRSTVAIALYVSGKMLHFRAQGSGFGCRWGSLSVPQSLFCLTAKMFAAKGVVSFRFYGLSTKNTVLVLGVLGVLSLGILWY